MTSDLRPLGPEERERLLSALRSEGDRIMLRLLLETGRPLDDLRGARSPTSTLTGASFGSGEGEETSRKERLERKASRRPRRSPSRQSFQQRSEITSTETRAKFASLKADAAGPWGRSGSGAPSCPQPLGQAFGTLGPKRTKNDEAKRGSGRFSAAYKGEEDSDDG